MGFSAAEWRDEAKHAWTQVDELRVEIERLRKQRDLLRRTIQVFRGEVYRSAEAAEKRALKEIGGEDVD